MAARRTCSDHTPEPKGYVEWHTWAEGMSRTHRQVRCLECGLLKIWVPKRSKAG